MNEEKKDLTKETKKGINIDENLLPSLPSKTGRLYSNLMFASHSPYDFTIYFCEAPPVTSLNEFKKGDKFMIPTVAEIVIPLEVISNLIKTLEMDREKYMAEYVVKKNWERGNDSTDTAIR